MPLAFFFDQHASGAIARGLRLRGVEVLTAFEDGADRFVEEKLLLRATALGRVLFTQDEDLLALAHQLRFSVVRCVSGLELIAKASSAKEMAGHIEQGRRIKLFLQRNPHEFRTAHEDRSSCAASNSCGQWGRTSPPLFLMRLPRHVEFLPLQVVVPASCDSCYTPSVKNTTDALRREFKRLFRSMDFVSRHPALNRRGKEGERLAEILPLPATGRGPGRGVGMAATPRYFESPLAAPPLTLNPHCH